MLPIVTSLAHQICSRMIVELLPRYGKFACLPTCECLLKADLLIAEQSAWKTAEVQPEGPIFEYNHRWACLCKWSPACFR